MVEIKLAGMNKGLKNSLKNNQGMLEGLLKSDLLAQKIEEEKALNRYITANPDLEEKYGGVLEDIKAQYDDYMKYWEQNRLLGVVGYVSSAMRSALTIYKWAEEQEKKETIDKNSRMSRERHIRPAFACTGGRHRKPPRFRQSLPFAVHS